VLARPAALALALLVTTIGGVGCRRGAEAEANGASAATQSYQQALRRLGTEEGAALAAVAGQTGEKYTGDDALLAALRQTALPKYRAFVKGLEAVTPGEPQLVAYHERLRKLATEELSVLEALEKAVDGGDGVGVLLLNQRQRRLQGEMDALVREFPR
jgi:hypothetical protein